MRICFFGKPDSPQMRRVAASLAARGHAITVVFKGPGVVPGANYLPFAIPRMSLRHPHRWRVRRSRYLNAFLDAHDVVSIQFLHSWGFTPEMMARGCFTVRPWGSDITPPASGPQPSAGTLARRREMIRCAAAVQVTCDSFAEAVARFAEVDAATIRRTPLGVDLDAFRPAVTPPREQVVGFLKGFGHAYGALDMVAAIPAVIQACPEARFELVGEGPLLAPSRELAAQLGVMGHIRWLPRLAAREVPHKLAGWCLSAIPSVSESFCIAALESAAAGVPVVAARVGGLTETVHDGETGLLVAPGDSAALAEAIIALLQDDVRRARLARQARQFVSERFAWHRCMDAWESFFVEAATGRAAPRMLDSVAGACC